MRGAMECLVSITVGHRETPPTPTPNCCSRRGRGGGPGAEPADLPPTFLPTAQAPGYSSAATNCQDPREIVILALLSLDDP